MHAGPDAYHGFTHTLPFMASYRCSELYEKDESEEPY